MSAVQRCFIAVYLMSFCFLSVESKSLSNEDDLAHQLAELKESVTNLEGKYEKAMSIMTEQGKEMILLKDEVNLYKGLYRDRRQDVDSAEVAFYAYINSNAVNIGNQQVVVFDHVITNIDTTHSVGAGYNPVTGTFTAPVDGLYVFSMTLLSGYNDIRTHFAFHQDNTPLTSIFIHGSTGDSHTWDIGSADAVVSMKAGQTMSIRHTHPEAHALEGAFQGAGQSMFSGFLLREHLGRESIVG
ncbi:complement C1q tumor necrosis factor-related protein 3-like [Mya arenaria]|uniref:complement C1q tumor necrosis factor-related protein 3-like n=1 Tax=Mya arenaria TaxID=6604 RepID=UPI0022E19DB9|nr:complement C1q tumor necrosis factor-related protein 3-like [Mya arenaria]